MGAAASSRSLPAVIDREVAQKLLAGTAFPGPNRPTARIQCSGGMAIGLHQRSLPAVCPVARTCVGRGSGRWEHHPQTVDQLPSLPPVPRGRQPLARQQPVQRLARREHLHFVLHGSFTLQVAETAISEPYAEAKEIPGPFPGARARHERHATDEIAGMDGVALRPPPTFRRSLAPPCPLGAARTSRLFSH